MEGDGITYWSYTKKTVLPRASEAQQLGNTFMEIFAGREYCGEVKTNMHFRGCWCIGAHCLGAYEYGLWSCQILSSQAHGHDLFLHLNMSIRATPSSTIYLCIYPLDGKLEASGCVV